MPGQTVPPFPVEITDSIINYLHDDKLALKSCSTVTSSWLATSHHHLFHTVTFSPDKFSINDAISFLVASPDVAHHIKRLKVCGYSGISLQDIANMLRPLNRLRELSLVDLLISPTLPGEEVPSCVLHELQALWITRCNVLNVRHNHHDCIHLLGFFDHIHHLHLTGSTFSWHDFGGAVAQPAIDPSIAFRPHLSIDSVATSSATFRLMCRLVLSTPASYWQSLRELYLESEWLEASQLPQLSSVFATLGPQLRTLTLIPLLPRLRFGGGHLGHPAFQTVTDSVDGWRADCLSKCTRLQVYKTEIGYAQFDQGREEAYFRFAVALLAQLPGSVRDIRVRITPGVSDISLRHEGRSVPEVGLAVLGKLDWALLDRTLSAPKFKNTRLVLLVSQLKVVHPQDEFPGLVDFLKGALPEIEGRGHLCFDASSKELISGSTNVLQMPHAWA